MAEEFAGGVVTDERGACLKLCFPELNVWIMSYTECERGLMFKRRSESETDPSIAESEAAD